NEDKSKAFFDVFFAPPPDESYVPDYVYKKPKEQYREITDEQIYRVIGKTSLYKATGPDDISNSVFTHCADELVPFIGKLFRATFRLQYYPDCWKEYATVVLRKAGKPDYGLAKAYRPITLLNALAKILSACVAEDVSYMAEKHQMPPSRHFGG
ncbi:hypothetical protein FIBSPDRAFT_711850, partial [Athelia psychrophila]